MPDDNRRESTTRYRREARLGSGLTSVVYRGYDTVLDRPVALKCAHENQADRYSAVLHREARHLAKLNHANIIPLYDCQFSPDGPVLILRYVESSLNNFPWPAREGAPSVGLVARQLAGALDHAAENGISHRDIKPDNVMIDAAGHVFLVDFGLAATLDENTSWKEPVGVRSYLSPDLLLETHSTGDSNSRKHADQFSLGVLLYELLTGTLPHDPPSELAKRRYGELADCTAFRLMRNESIVPCHERVALIPPSVHKVLTRMLQVAPEARFPSNQKACDSLADALAGHGEPELRVFLSYSRNDSAYASEIVQHLEQTGFQVWWDRHISYGLNWYDEIQKAMEQCHAMLILCSPDSVASDEVKNEWSYCLDILKKPVIPILAKDCVLPYRLYSRQYLDGRRLTTMQAASEIAKICRKQIPVPVPLQEPAKTHETTEKALHSTPAYLQLFPSDAAAFKGLISNCAYMPTGYRVALDNQKNYLGRLIDRLQVDGAFLRSNN